MISVEIYPVPTTFLYRLQAATSLHMDTYTARLQQTLWIKRKM